MSTTTLDTTWDGLEIAGDDPRGASVVVRRPASRPGRFDYLLLHRAHDGPEYRGWWAWTPPAGSRQPGESVRSAARRELHEEAGIADADPVPVDLSREWARFLLDVDADTEVRLIDPEHDRFEWVAAEEAGRRCRPGMVARQLMLADTIPSARFGFAEAAADDADVLWRDGFRQDARFGGRLDRAGLADRFARWCDPSDPHRLFVATVDGRPVGYVWSRPEEAERAGFGAAFTDPEYAGRGLGAALIWAGLAAVLPPGVRQVRSAPMSHNVPAVRAFAKAGFRACGAADTATVLGFDLAHWWGPPN